MTRRKEGRKRLQLKGQKEEKKVFTSMPETGVDNSVAEMPGEGKGNL